MNESREAEEDEHSEVKLYFAMMSCGETEGHIGLGCDPLGCVRSCQVALVHPNSGDALFHRFVVDRFLLDHVRLLEPCVGS